MLPAMNSAAPETTSTPIELPDRSDFSERLFQILPRADFDLSPVLNRSTNQLYLIQQSGQEYLLKGYGNRERFGDPQKRLSKEVFCLQSIRAENMAPELIGYDRSAGFMVMHFVTGRRVGDVISPDNYAQIARATGHWLARFHGQFERRECGLSAWDYFLTRYRDRLRPEVFGSSCQRRLEAEPLPYAVFAKKDAHKQNFLIASEAPVNNNN